MPAFFSESRKSSKDSLLNLPIYVSPLARGVSRYQAINAGFVTKLTRMRKKQPINCLEHSRVADTQGC
jgi:hypothetical protein